MYTLFINVTFCTPFWTHYWDTLFLKLLCTRNLFLLPKKSVLSFKICYLFRYFISVMINVVIQKFHIHIF